MHPPLERGRTVTASWPGVVAANVGVLAVVAGWSVVGVGALAVWVVDAVTRALLLVSRREPDRAS